MPTQGESGYVNASIDITTGGSYTGAGLAGYLGGTTVSFNVKMRKPSLSRGRQEIEGGMFRQGTGSPPACRVSLEGFYKTDDAGAVYPPDASQGEFIRVKVTAGRVLNAVILVERFEFTGDVDSAVQFSIDGDTDGIFTFN